MAGVQAICVDHSCAQERLEAITLRIIDKVPARRYQTVGDLLDDLDEVSAQVETTPAIAA